VTGKKVKWLLNSYGAADEAVWRTGTVISEKNNWVAIQVDAVTTDHSNPFLTKHLREVEVV
jgi:hypothetical protein